MSEARRITTALGGKWYGRYGSACCPAHHDTRPSLTIADAPERLLLHCKAGCDFSDVLAALRCKGVLKDVVEGAGKGFTGNGFTVKDFNRMPEPDPAMLARARLEAAHLAAKRERQALACWNEALPISGTPAEAYLRGRGITCALPDSLRYHPSCWHPDVGHLDGENLNGAHLEGESLEDKNLGSRDLVAKPLKSGNANPRHANPGRLPAMLARVEGAAHFAIHRTYLRPDGSGKADVQPAKAMLGSTAGGAVQVASGHAQVEVEAGHGVSGQGISAHPTLTGGGFCGEYLCGYNHEDSVNRRDDGFHERGHHASNRRGNNGNNGGVDSGDRDERCLPGRDPRKYGLPLDGPHGDAPHGRGPFQQGPLQGPLVVAEGIETALSLASGLVAGPATIWAALSISGMGALNLPAKPHRLIIATDGDAAGQAAGHLLAERAQAMGWDVSHLPAPKGRDWNDVLCNDVFWKNILMQGVNVLGTNADRANADQDRIGQSRAIHQWGVPA